MEALYSIAADVLMLSHLGYVTFVMLGFLLILIGIARGWKWVRNPWFRYTHLVAILIVVAEAWAGMTCPLTIWEKALRQLAGEGTYEGGFFTNLVRSVLFRSWPPWVFTLLYSAFGGGVLLTFVLAPPRRNVRREMPPHELA